MSDEVKKEEKPGIPDDFFYDYEDLVSKPRITGMSDSSIACPHFPVRRGIHYVG